MKRIYFILFLGIIITIFDNCVGVKIRSINSKVRMLNRGKGRKLPVAVSRKKGVLPSRRSNKSVDLESSTLSRDESGFANESTVGGIMNNMDIISKAPKKIFSKPLDAKIQPEFLQNKLGNVKKIPNKDKRINFKVRSISPRRITVIELEMGPQEMVKVLAEEAKNMEKTKDGINKGSAELACGRYSFIFHCEVIEIQKELLERRKDKYLYTVKDKENRNYAWNTAQGTYGRVVFGYIEVPSVDQVFNTDSSDFSSFYKLPQILTGVKVLYHGGGKYPSKYLLPGMKISVVIKSYFRDLYKIGRLVWNREREILYSLSKEFWTDGSGGPVTHTPTVFSVHYQDLENKRQEILFRDQENKRALVSELLIMERIRGHTFFEVMTYLQGPKLFAWVERNNAWDLWLKVIYKLQWNLNHLLQSFMLTGYILYMHCDLNRSNILLSIPELNNDHKRNLLNIISMDPWDMRLIDLSFVWVPNVLKSRNMNSICSQVNKSAIFSDANYLYVCLIELFKVPQKDLPVSRPSPLYKSIRERSIKFWELLDSIKEWSSVGVNFIGRNSSIHTRYKIKKPELGGNAFNECIEGLMLMSDLYDSQAKKFGIKLSYHSFSPEAYLRGYLHLSFRITKLGLCIRTKIMDNWEIMKTMIPSLSYFDFSVLTLTLDASLRNNSDQCTINIPISNKSLQYTNINIPNNVCESIKLCVSDIESTRSIPGDEVIKPAISVVTAENHESDLFLQEMRINYKLPESIQSIGSRLFGRFQGLKFPLELKKEKILELLLYFQNQANIIQISYPSEQNLLKICESIENTDALIKIFGRPNYQYLLQYARNYGLNKFCQILFKLLPNTRLFSDHLNKNINTSDQINTIVRK